MGGHGARVGSPARHAAVQSRRLGGAAGGARVRSRPRRRRSRTCAPTSSGWTASRTASSASAASRAATRSTFPALVARIGDYFRARVPTLANAVTVDVAPPDEPFMVRGDAVLLEWAMEVLVKNAVDALAGRGGRMMLASSIAPEGGARITRERRRTRHPA